MDVNITGKQAAEKWHQQLIEFKENMVEKLQKAEGKKKGWQKILMILGQSLTPRLLALEKKEPKLLDIWRDKWLLWRTRT